MLSTTGTIAAFRLGPEDGEALAPKFRISTARFNAASFNELARGEAMIKVGWPQRAATHSHTKFGLVVAAIVRPASPRCGDGLRRHRGATTRKRRPFWCLSTSPSAGLEFRIAEAVASLIASFPGFGGCLNGSGIGVVRETFHVSVLALEQTVLGW